jgi:hypothetical protein
VYAPPPNIKKAYDFGVYVSVNKELLMAALVAAAAHLPAALDGLKPDMGSMQTFAEALIAGENARSAATRAFGPPAPPPSKQSSSAHRS